MKAFLRQIPIFTELGDEELQLLAQAAVEKHYPKSSTIVCKDDPGTSLFIVRTGIVNVIAESPHGNAVDLATFQSGEFFGEMALFDGQTRSATVVAQEDTTVVEISRESFLKLVFHQPDAALKIMAEISNRFRKTDEIVKEYSDRIYREAYLSIEKVLKQNSTRRKRFTGTSKKAL